MKNVLKIQASMFGADGQSSRLADHFIQRLREDEGEVNVVTRDLAAEPVPMLTLERFQALMARPDERSVAQQAVVDLSDALIAELQAADIIVFAVPMYNFNIPAVLQHYFDHIARAHVTFRYTEAGSEGLIKGKQVALFVARGGSYGDKHSQSAFLRQFLTLIGLDNARFYYAEGLALGDTAREQSLDAVRHEIATTPQPLMRAA